MKEYLYAMNSPDINWLYLNYLKKDKNSSIFIPRKHTKLKYSDHKRIKSKLKNKLKTK
jgi:hypothetical protein